MDHFYNPLCYELDPIVQTPNSTIPGTILQHGEDLKDFKDFSKVTPIPPLTLSPSNTLIDDNDSFLDLCMPSCHDLSGEEYNLDFIVNEVNEVSLENDFSLSNPSTSSIDYTEEKDIPTSKESYFEESLDGITTIRESGRKVSFCTTVKIREYDI